MTNLWLHIACIHERECVWLFFPCNRLVTSCLGCALSASIISWDCLQIGPVILSFTKRSRKWMDMSNLVSPVNLTMSTVGGTCVAAYLLLVCLSIWTVSFVIYEMYPERQIQLNEFAFHRVTQIWVQLLLLLLSLFFKIQNMINCSFLWLKFMKE